MLTRTKNLHHHSPNFENIPNKPTFSTIHELKFSHTLRHFILCVHRRGRRLHAPSSCLSLAGLLYLLVQDAAPVSDETGYKKLICLDVCANSSTGMTLVNSEELGFHNIFLCVLKKKSHSIRS